MCAVVVLSAICGKRRSLYVVTIQHALIALVCAFRALACAREYLLIDTTKAVVCFHANPFPCRAGPNNQFQTDSSQTTSCLLCVCV